MGVTVTTGAGNLGLPESNGYPARFGLSDDRWGRLGGFDGMIVAGQRYRDGTYLERKKGNGPKGVDIYAPSSYIQCPDGEGKMIINKDNEHLIVGASGTSYGNTPQVSIDVSHLLIEIRCTTGCCHGRLLESTRAESHTTKSEEVYYREVRPSVVC